MSLLQGWSGWRAFAKLPWAWRHIVVYSESGQDWHQFSGLIRQLNEVLACKVCYVTSDRADPGLQRQHPNFVSICIPAGFFLTLFFQVQRSDVTLLTMMDLGNLHLRRSVHPVHYVYLFHSMGSTHMVDHADSFDHYDTLFCAGPHQVAEIRKREALEGLPAKHLFDFGHPRLEQVMREGAAYRAEKTTRGSAQGGPVPVILVAPTWGDSAIFNRCGVELIRVLLDSGYEVIMRPHYHSRRLTPEVIESLRARYAGHARFSYVDQMGETGSILRSDLLISDWSAMAIEYALGLEKPVLFIDVPRRVRNPRWQELGLEPVESSIRSQVGAIIPPDRLDTLPQVVGQLLSQPSDFSPRMQKLRQQMVFRIGHSIAAGAAEIARLAEQARTQRPQPGGQR